MNYILNSRTFCRPRCVGFARRRVGRGGRVILDRISTEADDLWSQLDYKIFESRTGQESQVLGQDTLKKAETSLSDDENISRDEKFISSSTSPISDPYRALSNIMLSMKGEAESLESSYGGVMINSNLYSDLCSRLYSGDVDMHRKSNFESIRDLLKKGIKREREIAEEVDVSGDDWTRLPDASLQSASSSLDQRDSDIVVDLVRTQCINRISNRNISSNNNNNIHAPSYSSSGGDTIFNRQNTTDATSSSNVIKDEYATVIKREFETDANYSDDENVNLASLSSKLYASREALTNATVLSKEPAFEQLLTHSNFVDLNTSTRFLHNSEYLRGGDVKPETVVSTISETQSRVDSKDEVDDQEAIYKEFLNEIRKNWLHFHPKTPPPPSPDEKSSDDGTRTPVNFSEQTPIALEMQRINSGSIPPLSPSLPSSVFSSKIDTDPMFVTSTFSYNDLGGDEQALLLNTTTDSSNSGIDFNLSGDSLTELNLSLGEDENEKMLENILEECQIDDLKTFNQTTTFWDGILEDGGLLDVIDDKKVIIPDASKSVDLSVIGTVATILDEKDEGKRSSNKHKGSISKVKLGSSQFTITNCSQDEKFFSKEEPAPANAIIKCEPPEELLEIPQSSQQKSVQIPTSLSNFGRSVATNIENSETSQSIGNAQPNIVENRNPPIKVLVKQDTTPASNISTTPAPIVTKINQVPINQVNASQVITTIPSNVKVENNKATLIANVIRDVVASGATGSVGGTTGIVNVSNNINASTNVPSLLMTSIQQQPQQQIQHQTSSQPQPQQHIIFRQITQSSQTPQQIQTSSGVVNATAGNYTTDGSGAIVIAASTPSPTKRQSNGPTGEYLLYKVLAIVLKSVYGRFFRIRRCKNFRQTLPLQLSFVNIGAGAGKCGICTH